MNIEPSFLSANDFSEGLAIISGTIVRTMGHPGYGFINKEGKIAIDILYGEANDFSQGLAAVSYTEGDYGARKWGYIDQNGRFVIDPQFFSASSFSEGLAWIGETEVKKYIIDATEETLKIIPVFPIISYPNNLCANKIDIFRDGMALFESSYRYGYINKKGEISIEPQYRQAWPFKNGIARVQREYAEPYLLINKQGSLMYTLYYEYVDDFCEGLSIFVQNKKYGYLNLSYDISIKPMYLNANSFSEGLASVMVDDKYFYIDKSGNEVFKLRYDCAFSFHEGMARIKNNNKYGFINKSGEIIIEPQYDEAWDFHDGLARIKVGNKYGYVKSNTVNNYILNSIVK